MTKAILVAGLAFGDEGKGATVDYLCRQLPVDVIVRYNGGCQAAHNVITPEGVHHTFSQFGAGMLASPTVKTHLSRYMLVDPLAMMREAEALNKLTRNVWERTTVHRDAVVVTPIHAMVNQAREWMRTQKGETVHGSCGRGIGFAREMHLKHGQAVLMAKDLEYRERTVKKLGFLFECADNILTDLGISVVPDELAGACAKVMHFYAHWPAHLVDGLKAAETMIFEGAQGVMLDETHGTAPHTTWSDCTFGNADKLLDEIGVSDRTRIGCLRTYYTRHGAGPFPTERDFFAYLLPPEPHNSDQEFAGKFRRGHFDIHLANKAIKIVDGIDFLALSHVDYITLIGDRTERAFLREFAEEVPVPIGIYGRGPTASDREMSAELRTRLGLSSLPFPCSKEHILA